MYFWSFPAIVLIVHLMMVLAIRDSSTKGLFEATAGKVLRNHVIQTHHVTSEIRCGALCKANEVCRSYNYKKNGVDDKDVCELNDASRVTDPASYHDNTQYKHYYDVEQETSRSCLDYFRNGATLNGIYVITDISGESYKVFCDFTSEPRSAWTLFLSLALKNRNTNIACRKPFSVDSPTNQDMPNWEAYRLSLNRMQLLASQSTHWRATTGFSIYGVDYTDYVRGNLSSFDIMSFEGGGECKDVEYVNIRGHKGTETRAPFWQVKGTFSLHVDSSASHCTFKADSDCVRSENNFAFYCESEASINHNFRGSINENSTTEWWFGGYVYA